MTFDPQGGILRSSQGSRSDMLVRWYSARTDWLLDRKGTTQRRQFSPRSIEFDNLRMRTTAFRDCQVPTRPWTRRRTCKKRRKTSWSN